jgi:hypothetical protein
LGCDFTSSPSTQKPIVLAWAERVAPGLVQLKEVQRLKQFGAFETALQAHPHWVGGFDLPFGLPRELVSHLGWPQNYADCMAQFCSMTRQEIRACFKNFCDERPAGGKFAHRQTDRPADSSPSMKWVNPPVAFMMHAGVPLLIKAGVSLVGLLPGDPLRLALEAYPGMLAKEILARRSYKSDDKSRQTPERLIARKDVIHALELGQSRLNLRLKLSHAQREAMIEDGSGDTLDAVICAVQAAWALEQHLQGHAQTVCLLRWIPWRAGLLALKTSTGLL